ncbi:MAG: hypothetical protein M9962_12555 [Oligoflexia bacterium]|nr:hypothetical protein [Oligoflexia bacterium]
MKPLLRYRLPIYLTGFLIGSLVAIVAFQAKRVFAPNFHPMNNQGVPFQIKKGDFLVLNYDVQNPGMHLAYGYPTEIFIAKVEAEGKYKPIRTVPYRDLVEKTVKVGPFDEEGEYVFRGVFYICEKPGDKDCLKLMWDNSGSVKSSIKASSEIAINIQDWILKLKDELGTKYNQ